ncbi:uncharacterized protein LOC128558222 [Mercenaria mercenaria]|uniref:uncharacterized protein LOC128558222 n=1 Tax=Mercenaria mercenaria TaxID=6596 RepID=UPI00234F0034|nr:uncharacterized protein LOC128558222 [Mercenaria mercenaria]
MMAGIIDFSQIFSDGDQQGTDKSDVKTKRQYYDVPEPPVFTNIPDLDTLFSGDGKTSLLDLQPSQWMPSSQTSQRLPFTQTNRTELGRNQVSSSRIYNETVSERGDGDDIYLGSQYPLVRKIGPSQVPISGQCREWNSQSQKPLSMSQRANKSQINPSMNKQLDKNSAYVVPRKANPSTDLKTAIRRGGPNAGESRVKSVPMARPFTYSVNSINTNLRNNTQPGNSIHSPQEESENDSQEDLFDDSVSHVQAAEHQRTGREQMDPFTTAGKTPTDHLYSPALVAVPLEQYRMGVKLRPVTEICILFAAFNPYAGHN